MRKNKILTKVKKLQAWKQPSKKESVVAQE